MTPPSSSKRKVEEELDMPVKDSRSGKRVRKLELAKAELELKDDAIKEMEERMSRLETRMDRVVQDRGEKFKKMDDRINQAIIGNTPSLMEELPNLSWKDEFMRTFEERMLAINEKVANVSKERTERFRQIDRQLDEFRKENKEIKEDQDTKLRDALIEKNFWILHMSSWLFSDSIQEDVREWFGKNEWTMDAIGLLVAESDWKGVGNLRDQQVKAMEGEMPVWALWDMESMNLRVAVLVQQFPDYSTFSKAFKTLSSII